MGGNWRRQLAWIAGFWTLEAIYSAAEVHYRTALSPRPYTWLSALRAEGTYAVIGALLTPLVIWVARRYPVDRTTWRRNVWIHLGAATLYSATAKVAWDFVGRGEMPPYLARGFDAQGLFWSLSMGFSFGIALYGGIVLALWASEYYRRYQEQVVTAAQLQTQLVQAQLHALRSQLDPHFLFNALNSISELVHEDPDTAERMIVRLSQLLRRSLETSRAQEVPLDEELQFLDLYLDIERTRFDDRLTVDMEIDAEARRALVPNLILQPLVENAIRHGIAKRVTADGRITIAAERQNGSLLMRVVDNGAGLVGHVTPIREGVGLSATRGRLEKLYGEAQQLELRSSEAGVEARILIPYRQTEAYAGN